VALIKIKETVSPTAGPHPNPSPIAMGEGLFSPAGVSMPLQVVAGHESTLRHHSVIESAIASQNALVIQGVLWVLMLLSALLTLRAALSGTWQTMWLGGLVSLAVSLVALWSIGSLIYLLTCLQLAAAIGLRRRVDWWGCAALLLSGVFAFGLLVYGLALLQAWDFWVIAFPLAFAVGSLIAFDRMPARWK
jgi:hypothetical protein